MRFFVPNYGGDMAWVYLAAAAVFEVIFALSMKYADGFTKPLPTAITIIGVIGGIGFLTMAMRDLPVSVAYPIWTAVGTLGTVLLGYMFLQEPLSFGKVVSAMAIVGGVAGLKVSGT